MGLWVTRQRVSYKEGKLSQERIDKLEGLGFLWSAKPGARKQEGRWEESFEHLRAYKETHGNCLVPKR